MKTRLAMLSALTAISLYFFAPSMGSLLAGVIGGVVIGVQLQAKAARLEAQRAANRRTRSF